VGHGDKLEGGSKGNWSVGEPDVGEVVGGWEGDVAVFVVEVRGSAETQSSPFILNVERPPNTYSSVRVQRGERPGCGI